MLEVFYVQTVTNTDERRMTLRDGPGFPTSNRLAGGKRCDPVRRSCAKGVTERPVRGREVEVDFKINSDQADREIEDNGRGSEIMNGGVPPTTRVCLS